MDEIEVTPEMISAGVLALTSCDLRVEGHEEVVQEVWSAMERVRLSQAAPLIDARATFIRTGGRDPRDTVSFKTKND
jgi:hypothetical protein